MEMVVITDSLDSGHASPPRKAEPTEVSKELKSCEKQQNGLAHLGAKGPAASVTQPHGPARHDHEESCKRTRSMHPDVGRHVAVVDRSLGPHLGYIAIISDVDADQNAYSVIVLQGCEGIHVGDERCVQQEHCISVGNKLHR
eukprot:5558479-Amphidinium_carterae.2